MKPFVKAIAYLAIITILDFVLRKGLFPLPIPIPIPKSYTLFIFFSLFALLAWFITKWFSKTDLQKPKDLGISFNTHNRFDFLWGFLVGVALWAVVSLTQAWSAGFSWELRPEFIGSNLWFGLLFIFVADLGTELFTRGYALTRKR